MMTNLHVGRIQLYLAAGGARGAGTKRGQHDFDTVERPCVRDSQANGYDSTPKTPDRRTYESLLFVTGPYLYTHAP